MGFFRGLGKFLGSTIFPIFLVLALLMLVITSFTSYENFKSLLGGIFEEQYFSKLSDEDLSDLQNTLLLQCLDADTVSLPVLGVALKCNDIRNSNASQLSTLISNSFTEGLYYKKFDCGFVECVRSGDMQNLLVIFSNEGNQLYRSLQMYLWIGTAVGLVLFLVSVETWTGRLKGTGLHLVFIGLPILLLGFAQPFFMSKLSPEVLSFIGPTIDNLLTSIKTKFIIVLIVGVVLLIAGYALGFYLSRKSGKKIEK